MNMPSRPHRPIIAILLFLVLLIAGIRCKGSGENTGQQKEQKAPDTTAPAFRWQSTREMRGIAPGEAFHGAVDFMKNDLAMGMVTAEGDSVIRWRVSMEGPPYDLSLRFSSGLRGTILTISSTQENENAAKIAEKNWLDILQRGIMSSKR